MANRTARPSDYSPSDFSDSTLFSFLESSKKAYSLCNLVIDFVSPEFGEIEELQIFVLSPTMSWIVSEQPQTETEQVAIIRLLKSGEFEDLKEHR